MLYLESLLLFSLTISTDSYENMSEQKEEIPTEMDCLHCLGIPQNTLQFFYIVQKGGGGVKQFWGIPLREAVKNYLADFVR